MDVCMCGPRYLESRQAKYERQRGWAYYQDEIAKIMMDDMSCLGVGFSLPRMYVEDIPDPTVPPELFVFPFWEILTAAIYVL